MSPIEGKKKLPNPVLMAAQKMEPDIVCAILSHRIAPRIDVNERDEQSCSALGYIAQHGIGPNALLAAKALIDAGADPEALEPDFSVKQGWNSARGTHDHPMTPLALVCLRNYHGPHRAILDALGAKKIKNLCATHPMLHEALSRGLREVSEMLVSAGADVNREDPHKGFPIVQCSNPADFAMLVAAGAKLNIPDSKGRTPLQMISSSSVGSQILSMAAAAAQAESQGKTATFKEGQTTKTKASDDIAKPLIEALFASIADKNKPRVEALWTTLNLGRDKERLAEARNSKGATLLHAALRVKNFPLARKLSRLGLPPHAFDNSGSTPLGILLGLSLERSERDRNGDKRSKLYHEIAASFDWSAKSPQGLSVYESLLSVSVESMNGVSLEQVFTKAESTRPDWLDLSEDGQTCLLSRSLRQAVHARRAASQSILERQLSNTPFHELISTQMSRPEFGLAHAYAVLKAAMGAEQNSRFEYMSHWQKQTLDHLESRLDTFKSMGVDPDQIEWAQSLATARPTLFAAIESWRIAGVSRPSDTPRARSRTL